MTGRNAAAFECAGPDDPRSHQAGAYYFMRRHDNPSERIGIIHACPCGCGGKSAMWFKGKSDTGLAPEWDVVGEWPNVTLSPSIGIGRPKGGGPYHWHGYLKAGIFEEG